VSPIDALAEAFTAVVRYAAESPTSIGALRDAHMAVWHASPPHGGSGHWGDTPQGREESRRFIRSTTPPITGSHGTFFARQIGNRHHVFSFDPDSGRIAEHSHHPTKSRAFAAAEKASRGETA